MSPSAKSVAEANMTKEWIKKTRRSPEQKSKNISPAVALASLQNYPCHHLLLARITLFSPPHSSWATPQWQLQNVKHSR